jgi:hypothetical protein
MQFAPGRQTNTEPLVSIGRTECCVRPWVRHTQANNSDTIMQLLFERIAIHPRGVGLRLTTPTLAPLMFLRWSSNRIRLQVYISPVTQTFLVNTITTSPHSSLSSSWNSLLFLLPSPWLSSPRLPPCRSGSAAAPASLALTVRDHVFVAPRVSVRHLLLTMNLLDWSFFYRRYSSASLVRRCFDFPVPSWSDHMLYFL